MSKDQRIVRRKERKKKMDINDLKALFRFQRKAEPKPKGSGKIRFSLYAGRKKWSGDQKRERRRNQIACGILKVN
jgi:hypothetical protein